MGKVAFLKTISKGKFIFQSHLLTIFGWLGPTLPCFDTREEGEGERRKKYRPAELIPYHSSSFFGDLSEKKFFVLEKLRF